MTNWVIYNKKENIKDISQRFGITPLTSVILCNRDIKSEEGIKKILSSDIDDINDAKLLPDVDEAAKFIVDKIKEKKTIRIVGDYDIDGVCATYILYDALKSIGADVSYAIPDRITDGYGINKNIIDDAIKDKIDTIITCDNGIAAGEQIIYAKENGIDVVVTDHHDIAELPKDALYIVNPKRKDIDTPYPFAEICGAVVAWKFVIRLYELYGKSFNDKYNKDYVIDKYLEFAMLATIGDIMPLIDENHIIAKLGLTKILFTKNKGLKKLLDVSGIDFMKNGMTSYHVGFIIGPLINAAGRMDHASQAIKVFLSDDDKEVAKLVEKLKLLNDERKQMTEDGTTLALSLIEKNYKNDKVLVVFVEGLGEQVAGIVAGRIKEKYNKPTIVLTDTFGENEAKASCRSIDAYDIFEALSKHKDMFLKFGGHKLAAGFSILKPDIDNLRKYLNEETSLKEDDFVKKVYIDAEYPLTEVDETLIEDMSKLEPFGQGFTRPTFATKAVKVSVINVFGASKNVVKLLLSKDEKSGKGVIFTDSGEFIDKLRLSDTLDILYYPRINEYKGFRNVDINVTDYK